MMQEDTTLQSTSLALHTVVDEAMTYLEPPRHEQLTVESVARAYTLFQQASVAGDACSSSAVCKAHPRLQHIESILNENELADTNMNSINDDEWMQEHADLYRALLLAAFLLLELQSHVEASTRILQSSVERCMLLLQVLYYSNNMSLPVSRYPLLQAVLDEPLVPLDKQERQYMYVLQRNKNNDDDDIMEDDDENVVGGMDRKELAREEQELLKLASKPLPPRHVVEDQVMEDAEATPVEDNDGIIHQGPLVWIQNNASVECHVKLHDCGLVTVAIPSNDVPSEQQQQQRHAWLLSSSSTCETRVEKDQSFHITIGECHRVVIASKPIKIAKAPCGLEFRVDSLTAGYAWVTSFQTIIQSLVQAAKLQGELCQEWKEEYDAVVMKQKASMLSSES